MPAFPFLLARAVADPGPQRAVTHLESEPEPELKRTGIEVVDLVFELAEVPRIVHGVRGIRELHVVEQIGEDHLEFRANALGDVGGLADLEVHVPERLAAEIALGLNDPLGSAHGVLGAVDW